MDSSKYSCTLNLGIEQLSTQDFLTAKELERKQKLMNQMINFLGAGNTSQRSTIKSKMEDLRNVIYTY